MLVAQFQESRRLMGRLDAGRDLVAAFTTICMDNGIKSGWIKAVALVRNVEIQNVFPEDDNFSKSDVVSAPVFFPTLTGNISIFDELQDIRLYGTGTNADGSYTGIISGGEVIFCEFWIETGDDIVLVRETEGDDFQQWVQLQTIADVRPKPVMSVPPGGSMVRPTVQSTRMVMDEDETSELNIMDMAVGDYVDHPRFGLCRVINVLVDEKVTIRLPTGKNVDLHLGMMRVQNPKQADGYKVFQLEIKKRS